MTMASRTRKLDKPEPIDTRVEWKLLYLPRPLVGIGRRPMITPLRLEVDEETDRQVDQEAAVGQA